ncbi:uncharacterized protein LOC111778505 [Cucurbita pepo subsp. pepo]|uniref:uncharacterized protein LOC111778505 n=1 Tax=Cucurbita pepo subsp. pepo TaxID=3664 RepID=UPI000C9D99BC|nr:uncharacterized protein LOC111778505 [Cucurbita pepo subsp. pepo]
MAVWNNLHLHFSISFLGLFLSFLLPDAAASAAGIRLGIIRKPSSDVPVFREAPAFRNGDSCNRDEKIHVAMTLDANYLRGTMAAVLSILQHSTCPENVEFHFLWARYEPEVFSCIKSTFPYLKFKVYRFDAGRVRGKISKSIRQALDQPLNYARIYLAEILPEEVQRVIYLDSDLVVVDDVAELWGVDLGGKALGAPEYCHANFTKYFTDQFWSDPKLASTFEGRNPCYFNTGVMVVDVEKWRDGEFTQKMEEWMSVQKQRRIYHLGSLPPFLLVLAGNIHAVDHRWNQHGLGGDNLEGKCRSLHPGPISLLHWSGKGKPWLRLDSRKPCTVDHLWAPYDLYQSSDPSSPSPVADSYAAAGAWSFGGLLKTLSAKSESVVETYRRDLQEFGSGLKKEIEVAQGSLETVGHVFDEFGSSVLKGTAQIIAQGKDAILAIDHESDSDNSSNQNLSNQRNSVSKPYSRFDAQVRSIQGDTATYCDEPEDVDDYEKWKSQFVLSDRSEEIESLFEENGALDNIHKKVVPSVVDDETFWYRYFYKVHKLKQAEKVRVNLVKRAIADEEEEDLSWDVDDDDDDEQGYDVKSKGDVGETVKEENTANSTLKAGSSVGDDKEEENSNKNGGNVEELDGEKGSDQKVHLDGGSELNNKDQGLKSDEKVAVDARSDHGESSKQSDVSIVSTQPSMPEDEDLGWDEIEDLSVLEEKKTETQGGIINREEMRKRLSTAEDDEDLDWGTDTE